MGRGKIRGLTGEDRLGEDFWTFTLFTHRGFFGAPFVDTNP
jgi:hypothetical protein